MGDGVQPESISMRCYSVSAWVAQQHASFRCLEDVKRGNKYSPPVESYRTCLLLLEFGLVRSLYSSCHLALNNSRMEYVSRIKVSCADNVELLVQ